MTALIYFLYDNLPGYHPAYTVAVLAVSRQDADEYIKAQCQGGTFFGTVSGDLNVGVETGAVTQAARLVIAQQMENKNQ